MKFMPSRLFHAVVVTGAALTACADSDDVAEQTPVAEEAAVADTQADAAAAPVDAAADNLSIEAAAAGPGACPPGSERPFPPCFWIL